MTSLEIILNQNPKEPMVTKSLILANALSWLNSPYIWGGQSPLIGFDCSGLVISILQIEGKFIGDTTAQGLYLHFKDRGYVETGYPEFGCLAFYGKSVNKITHVAYCLDDGMIIEAAGGDSTTTTVERAKKQNAYVRLRKVRYRKDLVAILNERDNVLPFSRITKKEHK